MFNLRLTLLLTGLFIMRSNCAWGEECLCLHCDTLYSPAYQSHVQPDSLRGLVIWARDDSAQAVLVPTWSDRVWNASLDHSIPEYFDDVSFGKFTIRADNVYADGQDEYFTGHGSSWLTRNDVKNNTANFATFLQDIMQQVDAVVDFAEYDWYGPADGLPDDNVDFVYLLIAAKDDGLPFAYPSAQRTYISDDTSATGDTIRVVAGTWGLTGYRGDLGTEEGYVVLSAHEWLHNLMHYPDGFEQDYPDRDHVGFVQYQHYALGSFDPLSRPGFDAGWPSPYIPMDRDLIGWDSIQVLDDNSFGHVLRDQLLGTNRVFAIEPPRNVVYQASSVGTQRFVVSYHGAQLSNTWEADWPDRGILIWHETDAPIVGWSSQDWRAIKLEPASGLFDWIDSVTMDTTSPNPISGRDSLDWRPVWSDEFRNVGSAGWLWDDTTGTFDQVTNPSSAFYRLLQGAPLQDKISHLGVRHIELMASADSAKADLLINAWTGIVSADDSLHGPSAVVLGDLTIPDSVTLVIDSGTTVYIMANEDNQAASDPNRTEIIVKGQLVAKGTSSHPIVFKSSRPTGDSMSWHSIVVTSTGRATFEYCEFEDMSHGLRIDGADSVKVQHCTFDNIGYLALSIEAQGDTLTPSGVTVTNCDFANGALSSSCGIVVDTNAAASFSGVSVNALPISIVFKGGWGSLYDVLITNTDTGIVIDAIDSTVTINHLDIVAGAARKGIVARSGKVLMDSSVVYAIAYTGIDAYTGSATLRLSNSNVYANPDSAAAVSIGAAARLIASNVDIVDSWIGFEVRGDGADSIIGCTIDGCTQYAIKLDSSDVADYLANNVIENDAATATNMGIYVNRQSVVSDGDSVAGGYNWAFNFYSANYSNLTAVIDDLYMSGKGADDYGLVLNGPSSSNDEATVTGAVVDACYQYCHLYIRYLRAEIEECHFISTGDTTTASAYGIWDRGGPSTGYVRCTEAIDHKTYCVYIDGSSSVNYGDANEAAVDDNGFYVTDTLALPGTKYLRYNYTGTKKAEKVWWGRNPPLASRIQGNVDYAPYLTVAGDCNDGVGGGAKLAVSSEVLPDHFELLQNTPNPFNPTTKIEFALPVEQHVKLSIYNILGAVVRQFDLGAVSAGMKSLVWNGTDAGGHSVGSGVYFYRIETNDFVDTKKMLFLK